MGWDDREQESGSTETEEGPKGRELGVWREGLVHGLEVPRW